MGDYLDDIVGPKESYVIEIWEGMNGIRSSRQVESVEDARSIVDQLRKWGFNGSWKIQLA